MASKRSVSVLLLFLAFSIKGLYAQNEADTSKKLLLASAERASEAIYIIKQPNVVFPDILKGNEEQMLPYIQKFCTNRRDYLVRMWTKGKAYLPKASSILKKYNLPTELKILLTLESAYNADAVSSAGAVGYWQFMDEVAGEYGLKYITAVSAAEQKKLESIRHKTGQKKRAAMAKLRDDRKNFLLATNAAARYLRDRSRNLDANWLLVVASYNCGVGNVWNAMKRSGKAKPTFWDIRNLLPAETRAYVMNFITLNVIFHNYELFAKNKLTFAPEKLMLNDNADKIMAIPASE